MAVIVYFACFAGNATKINPANATATSFYLTDGSDGDHKTLNIKSNQAAKDPYKIPNLDVRKGYEPNNNNLI
jgi:hypothetical protein